MKGMTLEAVAKACDGIYHGSDGDKIKEVSAITTDSRQIQPRGMFIAIKGARSDGHAYIDSCYEKGALCCISEQELPGEKRPYIQVESSLQALKDIAQLYQSGRYYGKCRKDQYKGNDCRSSFTEVQSIKDTG